MVLDYYVFWGWLPGIGGEECNLPATFNLPAIELLSVGIWFSEVESAARKLLQANGRDSSSTIIVGPGADICRHSQRILKKTWKNRCVLQP